MFKQIHIRLTMLGAGVTTLILAVMAVLSLQASECRLYDSSFLSFRNDISALTGSLEQQDVITNTWIAGMEKQKGFRLLLCDNGVLLPCGNPEDRQLRQSLYSEMTAICAEAFEDIPASSPYTSWHREMVLKDTSAGPCFLSFIIFGHSRPSLRAIVLLPIRTLQESCMQQRVLTASMILAGAAVLFWFFRYFTKKLLVPIEESRKKQARFIASASHELRTPVAVILSGVSACTGRTDPAERDRILHTIKEESLRMKQLLDDMLLLAGADSHALSLSLELTELDTLILDTCDAFLPMAREKQLSLAVLLPNEELPRCLCDPGRIRQVLSVLLHNAVSYTPPYGHIRVFPGVFPSKPVPAGAFRGQSFVEIRVEDDGPGIPDSDKPYIFDRFYRREQNRSSKEHFGLGLCIAREIVEAHHGSIAVSDSPDGGAAFSVRLPVK